MRGRFAQQLIIASHLAAYTALTVALEHYAKDKGAFITASNSEYAHGCYVLTGRPASKLARLAILCTH